MRAQHLTRTFAETWLLLLVLAMSDLTNGGVQGPIEGFNSLSDFTTSPPAVAAANAAAAAVADAAAPPSGYAMSSGGGNWVEPYFDPSTPRNVTALVGKSAYLSCRVRNLGNKTVSWIRHRDIHILTVGSYTYTSDQRFQATHHQESDDWTLQIKWAQKRDGGMYECQISTQPVRSYFVRLNVVVPTATILGGPDLHVDKGSTINLTCTVKFSPEPPAYIFWYHHEEVINYDSSRGGVSVITEKGDVTTSFLLIQNADLADSGKYSCAPSNADVASVRVHVLNGEHPEAMQTGTSGCQYSWLTIFLLLSLLLCYNKQLLTLNATNVLITTTTATTRTRTTTSSSGRTTTSISTSTGMPTAARAGATNGWKSATTTTVVSSEDAVVTVVMTATTKATTATAAARRRHQLGSRSREDGAATDAGRLLTAISTDDDCPQPSTGSRCSQDIAHNRSNTNTNNYNNIRTNNTVSCGNNFSCGNDLSWGHRNTKKHAIVDCRPISSCNNNHSSSTNNNISNSSHYKNNNNNSSSNPVNSTWHWLR